MTLSSYFPKFFATTMGLVVPIIIIITKRPGAPIKPENDQIRALKVEYQRHWQYRWSTRVVCDEF